MMRAFASLSLAALLCNAAFGQSTEPQNTFDIADVHASARSTITVMRPGTGRAGRYELKNATMLDLIRTAYTIDADKVIGGPNWLEYDRFDVIAKAAPNTPPETQKLMLQSLLADRFKLVVHQDSKPMTAFVLTMGKGKPKLKEADPNSGKTGCQPQPVTTPLTASTAGGIVVPSQMFSCHNITMKAFAEALRGLAGAYLTNTVTDSTGLQGSWDFDIKWSNKALMQLTGADGITVFDAIDKQLGLKLEEQKASTPVIVVDSANEKPTANLPAVATALPPPPPLEFEVADVKPSAPQTPGALPSAIGFKPGGRVDLPRFPMRLWIQLAFSTNANVEIVGLPKWVDSANFDIIAKAPAAAGQANLGSEEMGIMMRALLEDRFKMKAHYEDRPLAAYTLTAVKPKLKKADPANRTGCKTSTQTTPGTTSTPFGPLLAGRVVTCQNISMAQFADQLSIFGSTYVRYPALNATELEGAWDFSFTYSPINPAQLGNLVVAGQRGDGPVLPGAGGGPGASDPTGGVTLFDAVEKQLGLKLEMTKRPYPVLVVDHIEEKPADN